MRARRLVVGAVALGFLWTTPALAQEFPVNTHRFVPYKNYKFRVKWDGMNIPGILRVSPIHRKTQVVRHRDGGEPGRQRSSPGVTTLKPIVLERGRTHDPSFEDWANLVAPPEEGGPGEAGRGVQLGNYRKDVRVELYNAAGQIVHAFHLFRCWPSEYIPLGELDAQNPETATETLVLQCQGVERDEAVTEPQEPSGTPR